MILYKTVYSHQKSPNLNTKLKQRIEKIDALDEQELILAELSNNTSISKSIKNASAHLLEIKKHQKQIKTSCEKSQQNQALKKNMLACIKEGTDLLKHPLDPLTKPLEWLSTLCLLMGLHPPDLIDDKGRMTISLQSCNLWEIQDTDIYLLDTPQSREDGFWSFYLPSKLYYITCLILLNLKTQPKLEQTENWTAYHTLLAQLCHPTDQTNTQELSFKTLKIKHKNCGYFSFLEPGFWYRKKINQLTKTQAISPRPKAYS